MRCWLPKECVKYVDTSSTAAGEGSSMRPSLVCHSGARASMASTKARKEGLPKREPVSSGGFCLSMVSASSRIERREVTVVCWSFETLEMGMSRTESEMPNTKARMRVYVGEERKTSWSFGERIRRVGCVKEMLSSDGGGGSGGVSGGGSEGGAGAFCLVRGTRRGSF